MKTLHIVTLAIVCFVCTVFAVPATKQPLANIPPVKAIGGFHAGGRSVLLSGLPIQNVTLQIGQQPRAYDPNGEFTTGQSYVHYTKLVSPQSPYPLVLVHGGYSTGVIWEDTPDGRAGWQQYFARAGFDVYVTDSVERGRSGWSQYPEINPAAPLWANKQYCWQTFRVGTYPNATAKYTWPGSQFPVEHWDQYHKQTVPRWTTSDEAIITAYVALVDKICDTKCILLGHSQGGTFVYNVTAQRPNKVAAVITVEPGSAPSLSAFNPASVAGVKHFTIWGDNVQNVASWAANKVVNDNYVAALRAAGVSFDMVEVVPEYNMIGNSHFMMVDKNSDQVADIVYTWMLNNSLVEERCSATVEVVTTSSWYNNGVKEQSFQLVVKNTGTKKFSTLNVNLEGTLVSSYNLNRVADKEYSLSLWGNGIAAGAQVTGQHGGIVSGDAGLKASIAGCAF